jgi:hypothetical protein
MRIAVTSLIALAISIATIGSARAQTAEAETLFREGKKLIKAGKTAEACEKFEASDRLEPTAGTELNLGRCREKLGQLTSAWAMYVKAAGNSKRGDPKKYDEAKKRAAALEKKLIYLTISVPADSAIDELIIRRNGTSIDRALWNQPTPVDPNDYTIAAEAPGHTPWSVTIAVKTKNKTVDVPKLEAVPTKAVEPKPEPVEAIATPEPTRRKPVVEHEPRKYKSTVTALGVVAGGAFVIAIGAGLYANHLESESDKLCPMPLCADPHGVDLNGSAHTYGWIANGGWALGGLAAVGAITAWFVGAPTDSVAIVPTLDHAGLAVVGHF